MGPQKCSPQTKSSFSRFCTAKPSWAAWQTDRLTDTAIIGNNSLHLTHSMGPKNESEWSVDWFAFHIQVKFSQFLFTIGLPITIASTSNSFITSVGLHYTSEGYPTFYTVLNTWLNFFYQNYILLKSSTTHWSKIKLYRPNIAIFRPLRCHKLTNYYYTQASTRSARWRKQKDEDSLYHSTSGQNNLAKAASNQWEHRDSRLIQRLMLLGPPKSPPQPTQPCLHSKAA